MSIPITDYVALSPLLGAMVVSLLILTVEFLIDNGERITFVVSLIGISLCIALSVYVYPMNGMAFNGMVQTGGYANFFNCLFLVSAGLTILLSRSYLEKENINYGEYYCLIIFATIGMMLIASAADLIIVFLGIELMSISLYVLAGFMRRREKSNESALKYFLLGAFATGFLLYGIALVYGSAGTTNIGTIVSRFPDVSNPYLSWAGIGLILVGFSFKVAAVPFHMWVPDVYEGAPTTAVAFMSTGSKAAAFAAFLLVFGRLVENNQRLTDVLSLIAAASMIVGNVIAISQSNLKRMIAYSSIAHAGYILAGLAAGSRLGREGVLFYLTVYVFMNIGALGVISMVEREEEKNLRYEDYSGLSQKNPFTAALMAIFMFSLAGIPPFGGFLAKYYVFAAAVNSNLTWLAIIGVLTSLVSVYYYLRLVVIMYFGESATAVSNAMPKTCTAALTISAVAILGLGIFPSTILSLTQQLF